MGKEFGNLRKVRGIITFSMSPFEQRALAGTINPGLWNVFRRFRENVFYVLPPILLGMYLYTSTMAEADRLTRKNPKDYENDV